MVGATGFEPAWDFSRDILSVMCKPFHHAPICQYYFFQTHPGVCRSDWWVG